MYDVTLSLRGKRYNVVLQHFDALVKYDTKFAKCRNKRATVLYLLGRFKESIADIQEVLVLEKGHFGAQSDIGLCYKALGDGEVALEAYQLTLQANLHFQFLSCRIERLRINI